MGRFELYEASAAALRNALGDQDFETAWCEGSLLSTEEAIAYAQRGRPTSPQGSSSHRAQWMVRFGRR